MPATAIVNGVKIAETDTYETVDSNIYVRIPSIRLRPSILSANCTQFPPSAIVKDKFTSTSTNTTCPFKGKASYYTIDVDGTRLKDAAWYYPKPKAGYDRIKDFVAFYGNKVDVKST